MCLICRANEGFSTVTRPATLSCISRFQTASLCMITRQRCLPYRMDTVQSPPSVTSTETPEGTASINRSMRTKPLDEKYHSIRSASRWSAISSPLKQSRYSAYAMCPSQCNAKSVVTRAMHSTITVMSAVLRPPRKQR